MNDRSDKRLLARRLTTITAVAVTGFLCGWSALGVTDGIVFAVALSAAVIAPVFRGESRTCFPHRRAR